MKKFLIFIAIILFGFTSVKAQEVNFGAKAGVNFASFLGDKEHNDKTRTAFHVALIAEFIISDKFSFQPELMYSAQGGVYENAQEGEALYDGTLKNDYLNVPIMAKYYVAEGFSIEAGPQVGFLLSAKDDWEDVQTGDSDTDDWKDFYKGIDFGVNFGVGYKLEGGLNLGARYNLGLSNIWEDSGDFKTQNGVIQVSLGYFF